MNSAKAPFETKDTNSGALVALVGVFLILLGGTILVTHVVDRWLNRVEASHNPPASPMAQTPMLPPEPRLQTNPTVDLIRLRDVENVTLNNYAWVDPDKGTLRIPIVRAMALVAERGLPARKGGEQ